ncbi:hypothetical protein N798_05065 [Knoellia flava TL1]|nr:O-antigen polymerase [Knoellia flava]KGN34014.1 hypothetical protein N798_05065 [Knoellia flava TL1]
MTCATIAMLTSKRGIGLPATLHNGVWAIALLIIGSGLMNYDPLSWYAWSLIATSLIAFNLGILLIGERTSPQPASGTRPLVTLGQFWLLIGAFSVGVLIYLRTIAQNYGLATIISDPTSIREYSAVGYLEAFPLYGKVLFYFGPLCFVLAIFPELVTGLRGAWYRLPLLVFVSGAQVLTLQRTNIFVCIAWVGGVLVLRLIQRGANGKQSVSARRLMGLVGALVLAFAIFQGLAVALGKTGNTNTAIDSVVDPRIRGSQYTSVLHYASSGVPAFGALTESKDRSWPPVGGTGLIIGDYNPQTWGRATFVGPLKLVPGITHWEEVSPFTFLPVPTNVYTWLEPWYRDFRMPGVVLGSLLAGLIIGLAVRHRHASPEALLLAGLLLGFSGLATFINRYMAVMSVVLYLLLAFLGRARRSREMRESVRSSATRRRTSRSGRLTRPL